MLSICAVPAGDPARNPAGRADVPPVLPTLRLRPDAEVYWKKARLTADRRGRGPTGRVATPHIVVS